MKAWPGYTIAFAITAVGCYGCVVAYIPFLIVQTGSLWSFAMFVEDIKNDVLELNKSKVLYKRDETEALLQFCKVSKRFSDLKQFSK